MRAAYAKPIESVDNANMQQAIELRAPDDEINKIRFENWQCFMLKRGFMTAWVSPDEQEWTMQAYMIAGPIGWTEADPDKIVNMLRARWQ
jgi:hypothetical protein